MVAVTTTVPGAVVERLSPVMEAPVPLSVFTDHTMTWLVALGGSTVPFKVRLAPIIPLVATPVISVTGTTVELTVTVHVAVKPPSSVVTVMTAEPDATAVTSPVLSTVATLSSLLDHVMF
jgi:hypothetical protein